MSVADASARETADAVLSFRMTLSAAPEEQVSVACATADGTAVAGRDDTATSGTLALAAGETSKTVTVAVLDDAHDERAEIRRWIPKDRALAAGGWRDLVPRHAQEFWSDAPAAGRNA